MRARPSGVSWSEKANRGPASMRALRRSKRSRVLPTNLAGLPTASEPAGMSELTRLPAPTTVSSPIVTPGSTRVLRHEDPAPDANRGQPGISQRLARGGVVRQDVHPGSQAAPIADADQERKHGIYQAPRGHVDVTAEL